MSPLGTRRKYAEFLQRRDERTLVWPAQRYTLTHYGPFGGWLGAGILQHLLSELRSLIWSSETGRMIGLLAVSQTAWSLELNPSLVGLCC
jgi:hypothetical protein